MQILYFALKNMGKTEKIEGRSTYLRVNPVLRPGKTVISPIFAYI